MGKILLAAVAADEVGTVVADSQLGDKNQHLLPLAEGLLAEHEYVGKLLPCGICRIY